LNLLIPCGFGGVENRRFSIDKKNSGDANLHARGEIPCGFATGIVARKGFFFIVKRGRI